MAGIWRATTIEESKMPVLMTQDLPVSRAVVEAVSADVGAAENPPDGLIVHIAIETNDGVRIVDIWDTAEHFERFNAERLDASVGKVMAEHGLSMDGPPPAGNIVEAFDLVRGR
jgi:hypothetical protein